MIALKPEYTILSVGDLMSLKMTEENIGFERLITLSGINRATVYGIMKGTRRITGQTACRLDDVFQTITALEWLLYQSINDYVEETSINALIDNGYSPLDAKDQVRQKFKRYMIQVMGQR